MKIFKHDHSDSEELDLYESGSELDSADYSFYPLDDPDDGEEEEDVFGVSRSRGMFLPAMILLAVLGVAAAELTVCAFQAPELYVRLTDPFRVGIERMGELGGSLLDGASQAAAELVQTEENSESEELLEGSQLLDDTAVVPPPRSTAPFEITALVERDGQVLLTGGAQEIVYYNQTDEQWADQPYGSDRLGGYGCGPTAMAMAISSMTDTSMNPAEMAQWCVEHRYWAKKQGSHLSIVPGTAEAFGLTCTSLSPEEMDLDSISRLLATGQTIVALMGPGHFTSRGHFILLRGITLDGNILVADPASEERSLTVWDLDLILEELSSNHSHGGPLWALSQSFS